MNKKYQIFISSTYVDLIEERRAVQETILSMYNIPIGMEMFSADDEEQWETIKDTIQSSDYYVVIIGHKCGSITKEGISYTRKEYEYARSLGIPILGFIIHPDAPITRNAVEQDADKLRLLNDFINLAKERPIEWWRNKEELSKEVAIALQKQIAKGKRPGWIRADKFNLEETQSELVHMSKKIRELEQENSELKAKITPRLPDIHVDIVINQDMLVSISEDEVSQIKREIELEYHPITSDYGYDLENKTDGFKNKVEKYNASLPDEETLLAYTNNVIEHTAITKHGKGISIIVTNIGTQKANNVYVNLEFPDGIIIEYTEDIENLKEPEAPSKLENPFDKRLRENLLGVAMPAFQHNQDFSAFYNLDYLAPPLRRDMMVAQSTAYSCDLDGKEISIWKKTLIHTRRIEFDEFSIAAIQKGNYDVKCSVMCEEFVEPVKSVITIHVK